jgi:secretion/DNA translocation related TadE-like protein
VTSRSTRDDRHVVRPVRGRTTASPPARDRGSASVWLLAAGLVLLAAGLAGASVGAAHVARHQAQSAADLAALAGAVHAVAGPDIACARAGAVARANDARLTACRRDGLDLTVTVETVLTARVGPERIATATARAGPVRADDSRGPDPTPPLGGSP